MSPLTAPILFKATWGTSDDDDFNKWWGRGVVVAWYSPPIEAIHQLARVELVVISHGEDEDLDFYYRLPSINLPPAGNKHGQ